MDTNAYYFVDFVVADGPAPVYFAAGRESRLGSPAVVALPGATNRVPLLIGVEYAVTSPVPLTVSVPDGNPYTEVEFTGPGSARIRWPLDFVFTEEVGATDRVYTVTVAPYDPGGVFEWDDPGVPLRGGAASGGNCGCVQSGGDTVRFTCSRLCGCDAACTAKGTFRLEGALFSVTGGQCRCGFDDPPVFEPDGMVTNHPFLAVSFSSPVVIFEDGYMNSLDEWRDRRSTRTRLTIQANGGPHGGTLVLSTTNLDKLLSVGDGSFLFPESVILGEHEEYYRSFVCEGNFQSSVKDDIQVTGVFTENGTGERINAHGKLTAIRIELLPRNSAPKNPCPNRHVFGVDETVYCIQNPLTPLLQWNASGNGIITNFQTVCYICPIRAERGGLCATDGTVSYRPLIDVLEPNGLICGLCEFLPPDPTSGVGMAIELQVTPLEVSFEGLRLQEVPAPPTATSPAWGVHEGYFADYDYRSRWYHYMYWGGGIWISILPENLFGLYDQSRMFVWPKKPWGIGRLTWVIPIAWQSKYSTGLLPDGELDQKYLSEWTMTETMIKKKKHGNELVLTVEGEVFLNGERYEP
ncbi:MAG: hypothetical protein J5985_01180 [Kiritimatiellae bacterium]|nr:hypothetical protein [Kiritimatiellia bacterium]